METNIEMIITWAGRKIARLFRKTTRLAREYARMLVRRGKELLWKALEALLRRLEEKPVKEARKECQRCHNGASDEVRLTRRYYRHRSKGKYYARKSTK